MPQNPNHDSTPLLGDQGGQASTLDAFLFKDGLADLVQALMEEGDWSIPSEVDEKQFVETVFLQMRGDVRTWVRHAARYFLDNSEYFLSNREALEILDEELGKREVEVADSVRQAFLEFLYRDFPNFCSQAIRLALEDVTAPKH
jgi:hypothetical protein